MSALAGKVALVTGAGRGIGFGCAWELAQAGAQVVLNDRPGSAELAGAVEQIRAAGGGCIPLEADVFSRAGCEDLLARTVSACGRLDILVSNPAFSRRGDFLEYDPELFERTLTGTLTAGFHLSQLAARQFVAQGGEGRIIFISSVHAEMPYARACAYNAAKAGLNHLMRTIAVELAPHRVRVNAINPGWIDTPGERETFSLEKMQVVGPTLPLGRLGTIHDIGRAALFLAGEGGDYLSGSVLRVDGGFVFKDCRGSANT